MKTSLGNLVRIYEPPVILDEGHKATSALARRTIEEFNASVVVELSATPPKEVNILTRVSGGELLEEFFFHGYSVWMMDLRALS